MEQQVLPGEAEREPWGPGECSRFAGEGRVLLHLNHEHADLSLLRESIRELQLVTYPFERLRVSVFLLLLEALPLSYHGCGRLCVLLKDLQALWESRTE